MKRLSAVAAMALVCGLAAPASADLMELKWATEGYYRTRAVFLTNLAPEDRFRIAAHPETGEDLIAPEIRRTSYMTHRLRIMPTLSYEKLAKLHFQIDAMDNVLWGDNNAIASAPLLGELLLSETAFTHYVESFSRTGFRGGINWYRNIDHNAEAHPGVGVDPLDIPCLMLTADRDPALRPEFAADMPERCSNLEIHLIENAGHWVQQEQADIFNGHLIAWLKRHFA